MRILLVEDHPQLAESVVQALKGAGWTVDLLQDGVAADLALASEEYALAILDVGLPRMDGFEVLARLRGRGKTLPVLMLTARGEGQRRRHRDLRPPPAQEAGRRRRAHRHLPRPRLPAGGAG